MRVTLAGPTTIRLVFPYSPGAVAFVKALPGAEWDKEVKAWTVPLCHLGRIVARYARIVEIDYDVLAARDDLWRRWVQQHNACGVRFDLVGGVVVAQGDGVSPEFQKHVVARSALIAPWLGSQVVSRPVITPLQPSFLEPSQADGLLMRSIKSAAKREEKKAALVERVKAQRWQSKQASLLDEE